MYIKVFYSACNVVAWCKVACSNAHYIPLQLQEGRELADFVVERKFDKKAV